MAEAPEGMTILEIKPSNYEEIIERSQGNPFKDPYTREQLEGLYTSAKAQDRVCMVMFMDPDFWTRGRE